MVLYERLRNVQEIRTSVLGLNINEFYTTKMASTTQQVDNTKGKYELRVLNWITRRIYFFLSFINLINSSHQNCLILQQNWLYIERKNIFHQQQPLNNASLAWFNAITTLSLVRNIILRSNYSMEALYQCAKIAQSLQRNIRPWFALGLLCSYSSLNVFNLSAATKNQRTNYTFVKPKCVLLIGETRTQLQIFEVDFDYIR